MSPNLKDHENAMKKKSGRLSEKFYREAGENVRAFASLAEHAPGIGFYILDGEGRIVAINAFNRDYCNFRREADAIGLTCEEAFPGFRGTSYAATHAHVRKTKRPECHEHALLAADNSLTPLTSVTSPILNRRGTVIGTMCMYWTHPRSSETPAWHGQFRELTRWINEHYMEKLSTAAMARRVGMSTTTFYMRFQDLLGETPGGYLQTVRLNAARRLLDETDKSIAEIAQDVGFWDQAHFTKTFRARRGMTPNLYRQRNIQRGRP